MRLPQLNFTIVCTHLWSKVFRGTTEGPGGGTVRNLLFTEAKVGHFDVTLAVQQEVL